MLKIAGGILLALLFLALLPHLVAAAAWGFVIAVCVGLLFGVGYLIVTAGQSPEGMAGLLIASGLFLIWLAYEVRARRDARAEREQDTSA